MFYLKRFQAVFYLIVLLHPVDGFSQGILPQWMRKADAALPPLVASVNITEPDQDKTIEIIATSNGNNIASVTLNGQELGGFNNGVRRYKRKIDSGKNILNFVITDEFKQKYSTQIQVSSIDTSLGKVYAKPNLIAFIVGISDYKFSPLPNPINDAKALSARMQKMGYTVIESINPTKREFLSKFVQFGEASKKYDVAMIFYAGHGFQVGNKNYIVPSDFDVSNSTADVGSIAIDIAEKVEDFVMSSTKILILDSCRDNPFIKSFVSNRGIKFSRGLAPMELSGNQSNSSGQKNGTLISFSTKDGNVASDGDSMHSPYSEALLSHISDPVDINIVFRRVRQEVMKKTNGVQIPWEYGSLVGDELVIGAGSESNAR